MTRGAGLLLALLPLAAACSVQDAGTTAGELAGAPARVSGQVYAVGCPPGSPAEMTCEAPIGGYRLLFRSQRLPFSFSAVSRPDGTYSLAVPAGAYTVSFRSTRGLPAVRDRRLQLASSQDLQLNLVLGVGTLSPRAAPVCLADRYC
jgi:hypothetical protein